MHVKTNGNKISKRNGKIYLQVYPLLGSLKTNIK